MNRPVYIAGSGRFLPGPPLPFADIDRVLGPLPDAPRAVQRWLARTGPLMAELLSIKRVHYAFDPETRRFTEDNVTMAVKAAQDALAAAGLAPSSMDLLCYGSAHQDQMPTASVQIQDALGIEACEELSIHANCTSAYKALLLAHRLIESGRNQTALVLSSQISSSELIAEYYNQALVDRESLFLRYYLCDGAGAIVLTADADLGKGRRLEATYMESVGGRRPSLMGNRRPAYWMNPRDEFDAGLHHLRQTFRNTLGSSAFRDGEHSIFFAGLKRMLERENVPAEQIRYFQVNLPTQHVVESVMEECLALGIPRQALYTRLDELGYCGPPMAFICLDAILRDEPLDPGDRVLSFVTEVSKFMQAGFVVRIEDTP